MVGAHLRLFDSKGNLIAQWVSTDQPHPIRGLHFDEWYALEETIAPASYQIAEVHRFKIAESGNSEIILDNFQYSIEVTVKKIDQVTAKPLEQAHFEIYDSNQILIETLITDEEGLFSLLLKPGTYYLKEIQAPYGYQIDPELKEITITGLEPNQKLELVYENQLVPLPRTGPLSLYLGLGFAGMAMVVVGFIFLSRRK